MKINLIYTGRVILQGGKIGFVYKRVGQIKRYYFSKKLINTAIGAIVGCEEVGEAVKAPYTFEGFIEDKDLITEWVIKDKMIYAEYLGRKEMKKVQGNTYNEAIKLLRYVYKGVISSNQKPQFIAKLIYDITK